MIFVETGESVLYIASSGLIFGILATFLLDVIVSRIIIAKARYFVLHICLNLFLIKIAYNDALGLLHKPYLNEMYMKSGILAITCCSGFHIYHLMLEIKNLSIE